MWTPGGDWARSRRRVALYARLRVDTYHLRPKSAAGPNATRLPRAGLSRCRPGWRSRANFHEHAPDAGEVNLGRVSRLGHGGDGFWILRAPRLPRLWRGGGSPRRWRRARAARARARTSSWRSAARADLRRRSVTTSRRVLGSAEKAGARRLRARVSHCDSSFAATRAAEGAPRSSGVREDARAPQRMSRPRSVSMRSATRAACTDPRGGGRSLAPNSAEDQASSASTRRGTSARSASRSARRCRPI